MKKVILCAIATGMIWMTGCAAEPVNAAQTKNPTYAFAYKGAAIQMGQNADAVISAIGEPNETFEAKSCAFDGVDKTFYYDGFIINTYPDKDKDFVLSLNITDGSQAKTPEGVGLGMTRDQMLAAYGDGYEEFLDAYTYTKGDVQLTILLEDDAITDITYYYTSAVK